MTKATGVTPWPSLIRRIGAAGQSPPTLPHTKEQAPGKDDCTMGTRAILAGPAGKAKEFAAADRFADPPPSPIDPAALAELRDALARRCFDDASRARRALRRRGRHLFVLPLANPSSPAWLGGRS